MYSLLLILFFFTTFSFGQTKVTKNENTQTIEQYPLIHLGQKDGLNPNYLTGLSVNSSGELIIGTFGSGLMIYGGNEFKQVISEKLWKFPVIRNLTVINDKFYFCTSSELYVWNSSSDEIKIVFNGDYPIVFYNIINENRIIVSNTLGNYILEKSFTEYRQTKMDLKYPIVQYLKMKNGETLGMLNNGKIYLNIFEKSEKLLYDSKKLKNLMIYELKKYILIISENSIEYLDKTNYKTIKSINIRGSGPFTADFQDKEEIWLARKNELFHLNNGILKQINTFPKNTEMYISSLTKTKDGILWIGTHGNGLYKLYDTLIVKYTTKNIELGQINSIFPAAKNKDEFIITTNKGMFLYKNEELILLDLPPTTQNEILFSSVDSKTENIYVGGDGFILCKKYDEENIKGYFNDVFKNNIIMNIVPWKENFLIGSQNGLFMFDKEFNLVLDLNKESNMQMSNIFQIFILNENQIIFGNNYNLYKTDLKKTEEFDHPEIKGKILSITPYEKNQFLLGTNTGILYLYNFENETIIKKIFSHHGKNIYSVSMDLEKNFVIGTETGIEKHFIDGSYFLYDDRLRQFEVNYNSICHMTNGDILVGTSNGLFKIQSNYGFKQKINLWIDSLIINNKKISIKENFKTNDHLTLPYNKNDLSFKINLINFLDQKNIIIKYKLEGYDTDWGPNSNNSHAKYTNLPPGKYRVMAQIQYSQGDINYYTLPFNIIINPPIWLHPFSIFILFSTCLGLIYIGYLWFERRTIRNNIKLQNIVAKRTREINDINKNLEHKIFQRTIDLQIKNQELAKTVEQNIIFQTHVRLISSNTGDIVCLLSSDKKINLISKSVEEILGISSNDLLNNSIKHILPEKCVNELILSLKDNDKQQEIVTVPLINKRTNELVLVEIIGKKIVHKGTRSPKGYVLNLRNVTEREFLKKELNSVYKNIHRDFHDEVGNKLAKIIALISVLKIQMKEYSTIGETIGKIENTAKNLYHDTRDFSIHPTNPC